MLKVERDRVELLVKLLREASSLDVVGIFLKLHNVPHTIPNWDALLEKRLLPALEENRMTVGDLEALLADAEEHGRQHVFVYQTDKAYAADLLGREKLSKWAKKVGLDLDALDLQDLPDEQLVTSVRLETERGAPQLVIKAVEKRIYYQFIGEKTDGDKLTKTWHREEQRAVNVCRLKANGMFEIRIASRKNTTKYKEDIQAFWELLDGLTGAGFFKQFSLQKAKTNLERQKLQLKSEIRFSDSILRNDNGVVLTAAAGSHQANLFDDPGASDSFQAFIRRNGYCDQSNIWWIKQKEGAPPEKDIHVRLAGEINEFAITASCSKADYNHVLNRILHHAR